MRFLKKLYYIVIFLFQYCFDLTYAATRIAIDVITVKDMSQPGIIEIELDVEGRWECMLLANLITFSPGSMVVGVSEDNKKMLVHCFFLDNREEIISDIKNRLEKRVIQIFR